ncbi:MAG: YbaK/EbsC family protein [Ruminococcus sp.]|nr:YbaK/EbsC family protein [Ruminococcus sp.]
MSYLKVKSDLEKNGIIDHLTIHKDIGDTVEHASTLLKCKPGEIGKSLAFLVDDIPIMIVCAGDTKINSGKFKKIFHTKPKMIPRELVETIIGHKPGGVCPFGINDNVKVYLDISLKDYNIIHIAGGEENITIKLSLKELEKYSNYIEYIDVCVK